MQLTLAPVSNKPRHRCPDHLYASVGRINNSPESYPHRQEWSVLSQVCSMRNTVERRLNGQHSWF